MGLFDAVGSQVAGQALGDATGSAGRLAVAGLIPGGSLGFKIGGAKVNINLNGGAPDWRLRVSLAEKADYFYKAQSPADRGIMSPLFGSATQNGVIFPYTPQVQVTHTASYSQQKFTHSNHPGYYYENSEVGAISITGDFTVQNNIEGQYLLAAITFFRACTKMWFGASKSRQGFPPPMVFLNGYGSNYLPNVPCVVTSFSHTMPNDCDYIDVPTVLPGGAGAGGIGGAISAGVSGLMQGGGLSAVTGALTSGLQSAVGSTLGPSGAGIASLLGATGGGSTRLPTNSQLSVTLQPVYSRKAVSGFNLDDYAAGKMIGSTSKGGFI
jgi:hypothetical protein